MPMAFTRRISDTELLCRMERDYTRQGRHIRTKAHSRALALEVPAWPIRAGDMSSPRIWEVARSVLFLACYALFMDSDNLSCLSARRAKGTRVRHGYVKNDCS